MVETMNLKRTCVLVILSLGLVLITNCRTFQASSSRGVLDITYRINPIPGTEPSGQAAIWLEDHQGRYLRTVFVSNWLSFGGYKRDGICPDWSSVADWGRANEREFDAVTMATPTVGRHTLNVHCDKHNLVPGTYRYCVQAHTAERKNVLYRGEITIGGEPQEDEALPVIQSESEEASILTGVRARFYYP